LLFKQNETLLILGTSGLETIDSNECR
jgi:hypothetical protein